ncbi:MAG TPA: TlpA disulfide reductase family protein [Flavisolibacter sp.]|nr:TlpA disulfide reductase family protein [Flavisolibacter sp.]
MKKLTILLLAVTLTITATAQKNFEVLTKNPTPGSTITFEYMPRNTALQGVKDFQATAYLLEGKLPLAKAVTLKQDGGIYRGSVKTNDSTRAVFFAFAKDEKADNNNDEGYYTMLYDKKGAEVIGANQALAVVFDGYGGIWNMKTNAEKAAGFYKKEFANAVAKEKLANEYLNYLSQSKDPADKDLLKAALASRLEKKNLTELDMMTVNNLYQRSFKDKEKGEAIVAQIKERFPNGLWKRNEASAAFQKAKTLAEKEALYADFTTAFGPFKKEDYNQIDGMSGALAKMHADSGNYEAAKKYIAKINLPSIKGSTLNSIAWKLAGQGLTKTPVNVKEGLAFSQQSLNAVNEEKKLMAGKVPYISEKQYAKNLENSYHSYADTYATLLYHNGDFAQAYEIEKKAVDNYSRKNLNMNESFALLTEKVKGAAAAQAELEKFLEDGKYTPAMKEQMQRLYLASGKTDVQWASYMTALEESAYNKLKAELTKKMINMPAPQFALKDMDGKEVALSSLKGKVVVVDFWATWCGPCIASFPMMQTAVNKLKDNPDVAFVFIDTWENDSNRIQKVTDFIAKNKYTFHVLYDDPKAKEGNEFVVVENFGVDGIPTKFVIDRNSNIRFKSVGYNSNQEEALKELNTMIDMAAAESGAPLKKAF